MTLTLGTTLKFYKRQDVRDAIVAAAENKEIAVRFGEKGYGKRPDILTYPGDIMLLAQQGATSFHCSEELWTNPMNIKTGATKQEYNELRKGWDLLLDIDCPELEFSKIGANLIVQALMHEGIQSISVKFSGNHGFHIGVPFKAFPDEVNGVKTKDLFPDGPRKIAYYLTEKIRNFLKEEMLKKFTIDEIAAKGKKEFREIVTNNVFDPFKVLAIDTILISSRHLYRMPYSFNEKSGLISIPIQLNEILTFDKETANPDKVVVNNLKFLDDTNVKQDEARKLLVNAFDAKMDEIKANESKESVKRIIPVREFEEIVEKIPEEYFPPCIKLIGNGLEDGKKRALFILTNFLMSVGWNPDEIEKYLIDWNKKHALPLREVMIVGHMRYLKANKKKVLPPNCDNKPYYIDLQICKPDNFCRFIKNPAQYAIQKQRRVAESQPKKKEPKGEKSEEPTKKQEIYSDTDTQNIAPNK